MAVNDFLPFATGAGANVQDQASYATDPSTSAGFTAGIAQSQKLNKVWRQSSFVAAAIAQMVMLRTGRDVLDNGDMNQFLQRFEQGITDLQPFKLLPAVETHFFVNDATGNDANDGFTVTRPKRTLQALVSYVGLTYSMWNRRVVINIANGTYNRVVVTAGVGGQWILRGNIANPALVTINGGVNYGGVYVADNAEVRAEGITFQNSDAQGIGAEAGADGILDLRNVRFAFCTRTHIMAAYNGTVLISGPITIVGGSDYHIIAQGKSMVLCPWDDSGSLPVTLQGIPHFSQAYIYSIENSVVRYNLATMNVTGSATGRRFQVTTGALLNTGTGGNRTALPGDQEGIPAAYTTGDGLVTNNPTFGIYR